MLNISRPSMTSALSSPLLSLSITFEPPEPLMAEYAPQEFCCTNCGVNSSIPGQRRVAASAKRVERAGLPRRPNMFDR